MAQRTCSESGCGKPGIERGCCHAHYLRLLRTTGLLPRPTLEERFWAKVDRSGECWVWVASVNNYGYGRFDNQSAHRVAWRLANGPVPEGLWVCHRCDNPPCVRASHLFLGTNADNLADMARKGRTRWGYAGGESNHWAKLTWEAVDAIRARHSAGALQREIAAEFGISQTNVSYIVRGIRWKPKARVA